MQLNKWTKFRAGLDVRSTPHQTRRDATHPHTHTQHRLTHLVHHFGRAGGTTGEEGLYIKWNNNEIMYHVSTMLPYNPKDKQQVPSD